MNLRFRQQSDYSPFLIITISITYNYNVNLRKITRNPLAKSALAIIEKNSFTLYDFRPLLIYSRFYFYHLYLFKLTSFKEKRTEDILAQKDIV
ncbi:hypothetical protein BpHYR1_032184 [Brachionus plicatilis]|uniref:Uncharacterized protein n=1 Tax=Brachionus plicatilis TaxID=10195 RepID=A0A3M7QR94_BRAPC|nr:hypothetical protein BpHYR1_032184 [Brachionus plicatilis]